MSLPLLKLNIPKPILFPNELILKLTPIRKCFLLPNFSSELLPIQQENIFSFYSNEPFDKQQPIVPKFFSHQYCLVYVTTLRLIFIPFAKDINNFKLSYAFALPIKQIEKCHVEKNLDKDNFTIFINFHIIGNDFSLETSALHIQSKSRRRIIDIASLISAIRYAYSVGKNLGEVSHINLDYDYEIIRDLDTGYELFYHQLDPKLQNACGINNFVNADDAVYEYLPSYEDSEKAVGSFFKNLGLLNQIVIRDSNYLENLQNLSSMNTGNGFDYYYDNDLNSEFRPFLFINRDDSNEEYGNYYYKFLAENALRYSERNVDDIVQVIYDNLHQSFSAEYSGIDRECSDPNLSLISSDINNNTVPYIETRMENSTTRNGEVSSNHTILASAHVSAYVPENNRNFAFNNNSNVLEEVELLSYTNNTNFNPNRTHIPTVSSLGNIQDLIAVDGDTDNNIGINNDTVTQFNRSSGTLVIGEQSSAATAFKNTNTLDGNSQSVSEISDQYEEQRLLEQLDDNESLDFLTTEGYSRIAEFVENSISTDEICVNDNYAVAQSPTGKETETSKKHPNQYFSEDTEENDTTTAVNKAKEKVEDDNDHQLISKIINFGDDDENYNCDFSINVPESQELSSMSHSNAQSFDDKLLSSTTTPPSNISSNLSTSSHKPVVETNLPETTNQNLETKVQPLKMFTNTKPGKATSTNPLRVMVPNSDFVLNNNKFLENATDQSTSNYLSHENPNSNHSTPLVGSSSTFSPKFYYPNTPISFKSFNIFSAGSKHNADQNDSRKASKFEANNGKEHKDTQVGRLATDLKNGQQTSKLANNFSKNLKLKHKKSAPQLRSTTKTSEINKHTRSPSMNLKLLFDSFTSNANNHNDNNEEANAENAMNNDLKTESDFDTEESESKLQIQTDTYILPSPDFDRIWTETAPQPRDNSEGNRTNFLSNCKKRLSTDLSHFYIGRDLNVQQKQHSQEEFEIKQISPGQHEYGSSSMSSSSIDVCPFYCDPENPYSDIINNRLKYNNNNKQKQKVQKSHLNFGNRKRASPYEGNHQKRKGSGHHYYQNQGFWVKDGFEDNVDDASANAKQIPRSRQASFDVENVSVNIENRNLARDNNGSQATRQGVNSSGKTKAHVLKTSISSMSIKKFF